MLERDALAAERTPLFAERETLVAEQTALVAECSALAAERDALARERDSLASSLAKWADRGPPSYDHDHLATWHKNLSFLTEPRFVEAYRAGMDSGHHIARPRGSREDIHIEWRVAVCCWAASIARGLPGAFVECGVNTGMYSLAICKYLDFNSTGKNFYLFDTYDGIPADQMSEGERAGGKEEHNTSNFSDCFERAVSNFAPYPGAILVRGRVPETLVTVNIDEVSYLSIDMNIAYPERAAIEHFWPRLVRGAPVVLDDYAWRGYDEQKATLDEFAASQGVEILNLPTGQGLLIKV